MPIVTYPIEKAAQASRIFGATLLTSGVLVIMMILLIVLSASGMVGARVLLTFPIVGGLYILPGGFFIFLARRMENLSRWSFVAALVLAGLVLAGLGVRTIVATRDGIGIIVQLVIDTILGIPAIYLVVRCWNALPELRFVQRRSPAGRRGLPATSTVSTPAPPLTIPPPPARQMRAGNRR